MTRKVYLLTSLVDLSISGNCCLCDCDFAVEALRDLYRALNSPEQLNNWKLEGGDPCEESWTGVSCHQSSVIEMYKSFFPLNTIKYGTPL